MAHMLRLVARQSTRVASRAICTTAAKPQDPLLRLDKEGRDFFHPKVGNRDIVGFGVNGNPEYCDRYDYPFPAVRFGENTPEILALREKEKGDWRQLSLEDKKTLYRHSFRKTFAEVAAPTGEWKSVLALFLFGIVASGWLMIFTKLYVYPPLPRTANKEWQEICLQRMIDRGDSPIEGIASYYDYEKGRWKE